MSEEGNTLRFLGGLLAAFLSYHKWHSIGWAILHFFGGWFYVLYHIFNHRRNYETNNRRYSQTAP